MTTPPPTTTDRATVEEGLPPPWPVDLRPVIRAAVAAHDHKLVVLDDDPTGTQTVHGVPVLTVWDDAVLRAEFARPHPCFYVLTNSRSLPRSEARELSTLLARRLRAAAASRPLTVVSRSDSTLRGHYPAETDALEEELGPFDATLIIPYFEAGGRLTAGDVHYVAEGDRLVPAADTPFAADPVFGFRSSNLRDWVEEKTGGRVPAAEVASLSLQVIREGGPAAVAAALEAWPRGGVGVVNALVPGDLDVVVAALLEAGRAGRRYGFRTAAQFVAARLGLEPRPLLGAAELCDGGGGGGGLTVVGSHVPKTSEQLDLLLREPGLTAVEIPVGEVLSPRRPAVLAEASRRINGAIGGGHDTVVYTSRELVTGAGEAENLAISNQVSAALVDLVRNLQSRPRYLVAKGGITSSDIATCGLGIRRAMVEGQVLPGVPVWRTGDETRFPGLAYIVFPGNVGAPGALAAVRASLSTTTEK